MPLTHRPIAKNRRAHAAGQSRLPGPAPKRHGRKLSGTSADPSMLIHTAAPPTEPGRLQHPCWPPTHIPLAAGGPAARPRPGGAQAGACLLASCVRLSPIRGCGGSARPSNPIAGERRARSALESPSRGSRQQGLADSSCWEPRRRRSTRVETSIGPRAPRTLCGWSGCAAWRGRPLVRMATWGRLYHRPGLDRSKLLAFDAAVNTKPGGLPFFCATSPDHAPVSTSRWLGIRPILLSMRAAPGNRWELG